MGTTRIGRCSICGGNGMAHTGAWFGTVPPPPPTCASCNAVADEGGPTIPMVRPMQTRLDGDPFGLSSIGVRIDRPIFHGPLSADHQWEAHRADVTE